MFDQKCTTEILHLAAPDGISGELKCRNTVKGCQISQKYNEI